MKIAIPVESESFEVPVCPSFGRTPLFALADTETGTQMFLDNTAAASEGGAGIKASQMLADHGVNAVVTYRCGENAVQVLDGAKIELYKAQSGTVSENIEKLKRGELTRLTETHAGFHHHGGGMA